MDLMDQAGDQDSSLKLLAMSGRLELAALRDNIVAAMAELEDLHQRYNSMGGQASRG